MPAEVAPSKALDRLLDERAVASGDTKGAHGEWRHVGFLAQEQRGLELDSIAVAPQQGRAAAAARRAPGVPAGRGRPATCCYHPDRAICRRCWQRVGSPKGAQGIHYAARGEDPSQWLPTSSPTK